MLMIIGNIYYVRQLPYLGWLHGSHCAFQRATAVCLSGGEKHNDHDHGTVVVCFPIRAIKLQLSGWQRIAEATKLCTRLSPNVVVFVVSEATRGSERKPTRTLPSRSF